MTRGRRLLIRFLATMTVRELADRTGIPKSSLDAYKNGARVPAIAPAIALRKHTGIALEAWAEEADPQLSTIRDKDDVTTAQGDDEGDAAARHRRSA